MVAAAHVHDARGFSSSRPIRQSSHETNPDPTSFFQPTDTFYRRHVGPAPANIKDMLSKLHPPVESLDELVSQVLPEKVLSPRHLHIDGPKTEGLANDGRGFTETQLLARARQIASQNKLFRSYIGCGYAGTRVPEVIKRNVLENPAWYTSYTPYQAEISQGRLESLINYQTVVSELTGLSIANSSLLDEPTAAAEALTLAINAMPMSKQRQKNKVFFISHLVHPQTLAVMESRASGFQVELKVGDVLANDSQEVKDVGDALVGVLAQYPDTEGNVDDFKGLADTVHGLGGEFCVATDLLALTVLTPPGEFGADIAFGNAQRFGVPFGYGGPHAAFFACNDKQKRKIPGRLIGLSKDRLGEPAYRLALQTREQHIRREKATSNICTAQVLLANMSAMYAVYHGPQGLKEIANKVIASTRMLQLGVQQLGFQTGRDQANDPVLFDTLVVHAEDASAIVQRAASEKGINLRLLDNTRIGITLDETVERKDLSDLLDVFAGGKSTISLEGLLDKVGVGADLSVKLPHPLLRQSKFMTNAVFNSYHSETELLRYIYHLQSKDLSLVHSMIPLGSCTMKLNATTEMTPVTWPEFGGIHPFVPLDQAEGYKTLITELEDDLADITGFAKVTLQPNSGAQGEFTALRVIRKYLDEQPGPRRDICLIPVSAHGTNPASAAMAGMRVVSIKCDMKSGDLDLADLKAKCEKHKDELAAFMVTYPSTFGVFEPGIKEAIDLVHEHGGQVYMDGANMNAQIGLCSPGEIGADACHLNLHKTFCIPHGGGGPGVGPIGVKAHLADYLPGHPLVATGGSKGIPPVSGAPWGSASILPISWAYIKMMGGRGLTKSTKVTLLNANYIQSRLRGHYPILYTNSKGRCAHEFILDARGFKETSGIEAIDIAKRLQDYGFHAPTMSWPVANTLMIEPTESESQAELDRFCDALISIRQEIREVEQGRQPREGNVLRMSPHSQRDVILSEWDRPYSREKAAYPLPYLKQRKFWPSVTRLDDGET